MDSTCWSGPYEKIPFAPRTNQISGFIEFRPLTSLEEKIKRIILSRLFPYIFRLSSNSTFEWYLVTLYLHSHPLYNLSQLAGTNIPTANSGLLFQWLSVNRLVHLALICCFTLFIYWLTWFICRIAFLCSDGAVECSAVLLCFASSLFVLLCFSPL